MAGFLLEHHLPRISLTALPNQVAVCGLVSALITVVAGTARAYRRWSAAQVCATDEERAAKELLEQQAAATMHAEEIVVNSPWGMYGVAGDRQIVYANPQMEAIAGRPLVGNDHGVVVDLLRSPFDLLDHLCQGGEAVQLDLDERLYEISILCVVNGVTYLLVREITGMELASHEMLREIECTVQPLLLDIEANYAPIAALLITLRKLLHHALPKTARGVCANAYGLGRAWTKHVSDAVLEMGRLFTIIDGELRRLEGEYLLTCKASPESRDAAYRWLHQQGLSIEDLGPLASYWDLMDRLIGHGEALLGGRAVEALLRSCRSRHPRSQRRKTGRSIDPPDDR